MDKTTWRKLLKAQRKAMTKEQVAISSRLVSEQILASTLYKKANSILGYLAFGQELNIDAVLKQALLEGKKVYVPYIISATEFVAAELRDMEHFDLDRYGIRSVRKPLSTMAPAELELILVPAVAFARDGMRMGMGAGYYDRFLPQAKQAVMLGIAYEALLQDKLPADEHDVAVQYLVTEGGLKAITPK